MQAYLALEERFRKLSGIEGALAVLHWDFATMMPPGGLDARAGQIAALQSLHHERLTAPETSALLENAGQHRKDMDIWQQANLRMMRHKWKHAVAVENDLLTEFSLAGTNCEMVWRRARADNDFASLIPHQQRVVDLARQVAAAKAEAFGCSPYEALLDKYDPGRTTREIDTMFDNLAQFLPTFLKNVLEHQRGEQDSEPLEGPFPADKQEKLGRKFMTALGFDFTHGRLDTSAHPFCGGVSDDIRLTTRYDTSDFATGLMGILHETGHALYEQHLPEAWRRQPVGEVPSMTLHESQSLLIEMQVSRGRDFIAYAAPIIAEMFGRRGSAWEAANLRRHAIRVRPGLIRVDADEITYPLHIVLRYRIEQALIAGKMQVRDIPEAWNAAMKDLLDIDVPSDRDGCMQDIHWTDGSFGYFPTYTLGALYAAQFFHTAKTRHPEIIYGIRKGDFFPLTGWLKENIHSKASLLSPNDLLIQVTGEGLNIEIYKSYLKNRYLS